MAANELELRLLQANEQLVAANEQLLHQLRELMTENQADRQAYRRVIDRLQRSLDGDVGGGDDSRLLRRLSEQLSELEERLRGLEERLQR